MGSRPPSWHPLVKLAGWLVVVSLVSTSRASAQGTARSQDIDTSIRAAGMGGASAAVWWGEPGAWGNPASLASVEGVGWVAGRTQLLPSLASDIWLKSQRYLLGGSGLGVSLMGDPIEGLGRTRLEYGTNEGTDPFGNPTGTFASYEEIVGWGVGVSPFQVFDGIRRLRHPDAEPFSFPLDVAVGLQHKHTKVVLGPPSSLGTAEADCIDWGATARLSLLPWLAPDQSLHLDVSGGYAVLNANDAIFDFGTETAPPSRIRRTGFALHLSAPSPWSASRSAAPMWLLAGSPHAVELGFAIDSEHINAGGADPSYDVERFGLEATLFGMLTGRIGHVDDRLGDIVDNTYGFGVRLPLGPWASVAYDRASIPESSELPNLTRQGVSVWVDPVRLLWGREQER